ncbi:hypothetical protein BKI52_43360 [marine bacterium AO1-C]|nr:hypothetical protein BKI52_43360 [marine bacterium AO1-C]
MKIKSITLEHTNPSLGPHETVTEVTLIKSKDNIERITNFIGTAQVNGVVTLAEYFKAVRSKDTKVLDEVSKNTPDRMLTTGGTISHLHIHFEDGTSISLRDVYRRFNLSHFYPDFTSYMVEKGSLIRHKPFSDWKNDEIIPKSPPEVSRPTKPTKDLE